jgi:hypothetical protein
MNLGIYISSLLDTEQLDAINKFVNNNIDSDNVNDISIFYDNIGFNPSSTRCGMFNSADLWSFNGNLIVTSMKSLHTALNIVNNINIFYYYGWDKEKNVIDLVMSTRYNVHIIVKSESDMKEVYRLTGKRPIGISDNFNNIINLLMEQNDEHQSNNNDVYQTA